MRVGLHSPPWVPLALLGGLILIQAVYWLVRLIRWLF